MDNKKAQGLSITTLILIIIGVVILVVLIFGFTAGWGNIKDWIAPSSNVDQVVSACSVACSSDQKYDFCSEVRTLKVEKDAGALASEEKPAVAAVAAVAAKPAVAAVAAANGNPAVAAQAAVAEVVGVDAIPAYKITADGNEAEGTCVGFALASGYEKYGVDECGTLCL